ncbi:hypothetical protein [Nonomuraea sp. NPDC049646]|uniref:hypothetical protein n=1 Tax=unclassified Nonomuraea TaxID=2593643 RepID=UPI00379079BD
MAQAAHQAQQLLAEDIPLELDPVADTIRLAASLPTADRAEIVAHRLDMEPQAFRRLLNTYTLAGAEGVDVTLHPHPGAPRSSSRPPQRSRRCAPTRALR